MNLSQLYYFNKLAELEHYTKAAKELYITQPALSDAIHSLEHELGIPLFQKSGRNVKLTRYGREFDGYVSAALSELDKGIAVAKAYTDELTGEIKIGALFTLMGDYIPALLNGFRDQVTPSVKFELFQGVTANLIEGLRRDLYDVVFTARPDDATGLQCIKALSQQLVACVSVDSDLAERKSVSLKDLKGKKVVSYRRDMAIGAEVAALLAMDGSLNGVVHEYQDEVSMGMLLSGEKDTVALCILTQSLLSVHNVVFIPIDEAGDDFHDLFMVSKRGFQTPLVGEFVAFAEGFVPDANLMPSAR